MLVTGTLTSDGSTPVTFPPLVYNGTVNGKPQYHAAGDTHYVNWTVEGEWYLQVDGGALWFSTDNVATPDLVTTWSADSPATGTPVVAAAVSNSAQAKAAIEAAATADALITVAHAPGNDGTGALAAMTATHLAIDLPSGYTI